MIEERLYQRLVTLCPNVYPGSAPEGYPTPCVIYNRRRTKASRDLSGDDGTDTVTFQIDSYALTLKDSATLSRTIRASLKAWDEDDVQSVAMTDRQHLIDDTTETDLHRVMQLFELWCEDD